MLLHGHNSIQGTLAYGQLKASSKGGVVISGHFVHVHFSNAVGGIKIDVTILGASLQTRLYTGTCMLCKPSPYHNP